MAKLEPDCSCNNGWVCEDHPDQPWGHDGCGTAGELCTNPQCEKDADSIFLTVHCRVQTTTSVLEANPVVESNGKCPKCARGTMKLIPTPEQLVPKLPEKNKLTAECDNCGHKDEVKVVVTDE